MINDISVPLGRRIIGNVLRHHRTAAGYSLNDIAKLLECDRSKISRIETGQCGIRVKELRKLLAGYAVPEPEQDILLAIAGADRQHRWWRAYADRAVEMNHLLLPQAGKATHWPSSSRR